MAKDIKRHISHLKSSGTTAPAAADLVYGEIAVGYGAGNEVLYIKNSSDQIIPFVNGASALAEAQTYADSGDVSTVTGDTEITVTLSDKASSGRTLTITHAAGSAQSGFKKLSSDSYGHITGGSNVALSDLTGLGALSGVTGEQGISASSRSNGNQKIGHTNRITAGTAKGSSGSISHGGTIDIPSITYDSNGHITSSGKTTVTLPGNDNYITGVTATNSGISLDVTSKVLKAGHTNSITAGSAKTSSTTVTATTSGSNIAIPVIQYDVHGHVINTGTTNVSLKVNAAATNTAGVVKIATTTGTNNTDTVMTQSAVTKAIEDSFTVQDAMRYKGTLTGTTQFERPTNYNVGDTYKVATAFTTTAGVKLEVGDMVIAQASGATFDASNFNFIQANLDPTAYVVTTRKVTGSGALGGGGDLTTDRSITHNALAPSGASGTTSPNEAQTPGFNANFNVPVIKYDKYGHITATTTTTVKIPASASSWTNNYYVTGATVTTSTTKVDVALSGNNAAAKASFTIPSATTTAAGVMTSDDRTKMNTLVNLTGNASTLSAITATSTAINSLTGSVGSMAFQNTGSYSSATQVNTALGGKVGTGRKISTGAGLTGGGDLTADRTIKCALSSETKSTLTAATKGTTASREYAVGLDKNGVLSVNIPWTNTNSAYAMSAFSTVSVVGTSTVNVVADQKHDTITFAKDDAITLTGDATNDKVTFGLGDIVCGDYA